MLNKTTKSEQERRLDAIVASLITIDFIPGLNENKDLINQELTKIGLQTEILEKMDATELKDHLVKFQLGWNHMEVFADFLVKYSSPKLCFKNKAKYIYEYIQSNSKAFSFEIMNKLAQL
ncbi:hypothetical protein [Myroides sp. LJL119]